MAPTICIMALVRRAMAARDPHNKSLSASQTSPSWNHRTVSKVVVHQVRGVPGVACGPEAGAYVRLIDFCITQL